MPLQLPELRFVVPPTGAGRQIRRWEVLQLGHLRRRHQQRRLLRERRQRAGHPVLAGAPAREQAEHGKDVAAGPLRMTAVASSVTSSSGMRRGRRGRGS